ncbi:MAG TPA: hypothetical protein VIL99_14320 [Ignavibacteria bacterium]
MKIIILIKTFYIRMAHSISKTVKQLIKDSEIENLNLKQLADKLGFNYTTFVDFLKNDYDSWQSKYLILVADYYHTSVDFLLGRDEKAEIKKLRKELHEVRLLLKMIANNRIPVKEVTKFYRNKFNNPSILLS